LLFQTESVLPVGLEASVFTALIPNIKSNQKSEKSGCTVSFFRRCISSYSECLSQFPGKGKSKN